MAEKSQAQKPETHNSRGTTHTRDPRPREKVPRICIYYYLFIQFCPLVEAPSSGPNSVATDERCLASGQQVTTPTAQMTPVADQHAGTGTQEKHHETRKWTQRPTNCREDLTDVTPNSQGLHHCGSLTGPITREMKGKPC
ncbi:unnamed protein product [Allacma fusca]|uniref:Uncharacterized protein n=1 Tax=Allacma fusca TaxID=39272 RepID=A0A8J2KJK3_9HEXA|nr:unnamed protein product [Allacma fusca]